MVLNITLSGVGWSNALACVKPGFVIATNIKQVITSLEVHSDASVKNAEQLKFRRKGKIVPQRKV